MAEYITVRGKQIGLSAEVIDITADNLVFKDADDVYKIESVDDIITAIAGNGLKNSSSLLALDLNELSAVAVDVSADSVAIVDATDSSTKKEALADIVTAIAGVGLSATSGVLALDVNELVAEVIDVSADNIVFEDATDGGTHKESVADLASGMAGNGLSAGSGAIALDLNELTGAVVDVSADSIAIIDATDNSSKKESIADLATAMAGTGITATNGVLSADTVADNIIESDIKYEDESANCDGNNTTFTLGSTPIANSLMVFLNGVKQMEGSAKSYTLTGTTVEFTNAPASSAILDIHYIADN